MGGFFGNGYRNEGMGMDYIWLILLLNCCGCDIDPCLLILLLCCGGCGKHDKGGCYCK